MDSNKEIKKVFELYSTGKYKEAQELNNKILEVFPNQMYAKRYEKILADKINLNLNKEKTIKVKGKSLKCPHCLAKISFSGLTEEQRNKIKSGSYNNLEIKCPYCHTKFILQKRKANSILGLKIGDIATIDGKKYRATGYVEYRGRWYEGNYSGSTNYLEWLLLGENNNYYYFSEGKSYDDGEAEIEFELSKKIIPDFRIPSNFKEFIKVTVKSIYGENSKNYIVGEKTELYEFSQYGKNYVKEVEGSGSQKEAGIYETQNLSGKEASKIFGKKYNISNNFKKSGEGSSVGLIIFAIIFGINFLSFIPVEYIFGGFGLIIVGILFYIFKDDIPEKYSKTIYFIVALPIFSFFIFQPIFNSILENKQKIEISDLKEAKKAEVKFNDNSLMNQRQTSSSRYDYGGIRTYYEKREGLKFSVKSDEDKKIIEKIKNGEAGGEVKKIFNGVIYKLK